MDFIAYILDQSAWLYTKIYQNKLFFFDLWSIVHCWSGFSIYLVLRAIRLKHPLVILASILITYEVIEILFVYFAFMVFHPETIKDQFTDIFVGITGAILCKVYLNIVSEIKDKNPLPVALTLMFIVSFTYAFPWVGFYHYHYNVEAYNFPGINWSTVLAWTLGGIYILLIVVYAPARNLILRIVLAWTSFFILLLLFEYFYYYILEVRETSGLPLKPLIFGVCHGTRKMHVFYLLAPFMIILLFAFGDWLIRRTTGRKASMVKYW